MLSMADRGNRRFGLLDRTTSLTRVSTDKLLEVNELTKSFYGVAANDLVSFDLRVGEVHGLLGENGAGKSTLCSVLAGLYRPDSGEILLNGKATTFGSPLDAAQQGIGMVYQHFRLVPSFTVAENMVLGQPDQGMRLSLHQVEERVADIAEEFGLAVDPTAAIWQLSVGEQQRVEILKQLFRGARILILDEPTAVLAPQESDRLFEIVGEMARSGRSMILVSHKMEEIMNHTDRVTVLRHGRNAGTIETDQTTAAELAQLMIGADGSEQPAKAAARSAEVGDPVLTVSELQANGDRGYRAVDGASLCVRAGEIVGIAGVAGNGQRELQEAITGLRAVVGGSVALGERDITRLSPRARASAGLAYVPEDRLGTGLASGLTLEENLVLKSYKTSPYSRRGVLSPGKISSTARELTAQFDVRGAREGMPVSLMSGGNLQKAILARELTQPHDVLLAASPTRGLDLAAAAAVHGHLKAEANDGRGVLLFSEDLAEITALSDLILVMCLGRIVGSYTPETLDIAELGLLMTGAKVHD